MGNLVAMQRANPISQCNQDVRIAFVQPNTFMSIGQGYQAQRRKLWTVRVYYPEMELHSH